MEAALTSESNWAASSRQDVHSAGWTEEKLVAAAKGGSRHAFEQLVERHQCRVFRLAQAIAQNREDAEEITQDAFAQAFKNLSRFRGDSRFFTWLVRITINTGLMKLRRRRAGVISIDEQAEDEDSMLLRELEDHGPTPERRCLQQEVRNILATSIDQLSRGHRRVFELHGVEGYSTEETARELHISLTAVKSRFRRARLQLRKSLSQRFEAARGFHRNFEQTPSCRFPPKLSERGPLSRGSAGLILRPRACDSAKRSCRYAFGKAIISELELETFEIRAGMRQCTQ
jgi:RNA polymerase sigma-70 factor (ECF subfamily)